MGFFLVLAAYAAAVLVVNARKARVNEEMRSAATELGLRFQTEILGRVASEADLARQKALLMAVPMLSAVHLAGRINNVEVSVFPHVGGLGPSGIRIRAFLPRARGTGFLITPAGLERQRLGAEAQRVVADPTVRRAVDELFALEGVKVIDHLSVRFSTRPMVTDPSRLRSLVDVVSRTALTIGTTS